MSVNEASSALDLDAYLKRIEYRGPRSATADALATLHLAHATHIPFENLDILLGKPIRLDLASLQKKLVDGRRGGYCFEQNTLFAAVLEAFGFSVTRLAARVRLGASQVLPRTHKLLKVEAEGISWLADVGFGTEGLLQPIPLIANQPVQQFAWTYRLMEEAGLWVLQSWKDGNWLDLYAFTLEVQHFVDYEVASHYTSTYPASRFVLTLTAQLSTPKARYLLRNWEYTVSHGHQATTRAIANDEELLELLAKHFGLSFPAGTRFQFKSNS